MKYKLMDETKTTKYGVVLRRICALRDIPRCSVRKDDLGGWVENESNLSQDGDAWISENAEVYDDAQVSGNARVSENAVVFGDAKVFGYAQVSGDAWVSGYAQIGGEAQVIGNAQVGGYAKVGGNAQVGGYARVSGDAQVFGIAWVCENAKVFGYAKVCENAKVCGNARVCGDAVVRSSADYLVFKNSWSSYRWFTYTLSNKMWKVGCFYGTGEELIRKAYADSDKSGRCYEAIVRAVESIESATAEERATRQISTGCRR